MEKTKANRAVHDVVSNVQQYAGYKYGKKFLSVDLKWVSDVSWPKRRLQRFQCGGSLYLHGFLLAHL